MHQRPIPPLIERHAGDAAFYWLQFDQSAHSPLVGLAELVHFDRLLAAHLDGLHVAGTFGWEAARAKLARWQGPGEAFVATRLALAEAFPPRRMAQVWTEVARAPHRMLRGVIGAVLRATPEEAAPWVEAWTAPRVDAAFLVAGWRAVACGRAQTLPALQPMLTRRLAPALTHTDARVRAAAWRASTALGVGEAVTALDDDLAVRAEAAIAIAHPQATTRLFECVLAQAELAESLRARAANQARARLARWARALALRLPPGHPAVATLLNRLPARIGLSVALHHGDPALLGWIAARAADPDVARLAGWCWAALSGLDLETHGLAVPPVPSENARTERPTDRLDPGLPEPDAHALAAQTPTLPPGGPCLHGSALDHGLQAQLLMHAPQALRTIAAARLQASGGPPIDTRAPARVQLEQLHAVGVDSTLDETPHHALA